MRRLWKTSKKKILLFFVCLFFPKEKEKMPNIDDPEEEKKYANQIITINDQMYLCPLYK